MEPEMCSKKVTAMNSKQWIIVIYLLVTTCIQGVKADETQNAVIAAGIVAGLLLILVIAAVVFFVMKSSRGSKHPHKKPPYTQHLTRSGILPVPTSKKKRRFDIPKVHGSPNGKAFTQHAATPRQRPPVMFYSVSGDPRAQQSVPANQPDLIPIGPQYPYRAPPTVGRPVIFLDWSGGPNGATANGPQITEVAQKEEKRRTRSKSRESRRKKRTKSQSKIQSQSEENAGEDSGHHSHNETDESPNYATPSNFILTTKDIDIGSFSRRAPDDVNNNKNMDQIFEYKSDSDTVERFLLERMEASENKVPKEQDFVSGDGPFSVTQMRSTHRGLGSTTTQDQEKLIAFDADEDDHKEEEEDVKKDESIPPSLSLNFLSEDTPRPDYSFNLTTKTSVTKQTVVEDIPEPTPRVDYGNGLSSPAVSFDAPQVTPRVDYLNESHSKSKNDVVDLDDIIAMGTTTRTETRSETQSETGELETENMGSRSPPPVNYGYQQYRSSRFNSRDDFASSYHDTSAMERLDNLARPPTPPLAPPPPPPPPPLFPPPSLPAFKGTKHRPPTPPPGMIMNRNASLNIDDIILLGESKPSSSKTHGVKDSFPKKPVGSQGRESGLPFMEELRRRQRSVDDIGPPPPQTNPPESAMNRFERPDPDNDELASGLALIENRRTSVVQFAQDPPQIIPRAEFMDSFPENSPTQKVDASELLPQPIFPSTPPPLSGAGIPVLY